VPRERDRGVIAVLAALCAATGVHLVLTQGRERAPLPIVGSSRRRGDWLVQAGLEGVRRRDVVGALVGVGVFGAAVAYAIFGGVVAAAIAGLFAATMPLAAFRARRERRRFEAREAWPRIIEEIRLLTGTVGRSIPQALFEAGRRAPAELHPAFADAQREWLLSTDFARTLDVLKAKLADATADVVCETLLVAHQTGGGDVERYLGALADDRQADLQGRKDALAQQAGARFARRFVLAVPLGMALAGLSIGSGRAAYRTAGGQVAVVVALVLLVGCWIWAGRIMRLPDEERVFAGVVGDGRPS
jgi:tight adherence protein B